MPLKGDRKVSTPRFVNGRYLYEIHTGWAINIFTIFCPDILIDICTWQELIAVIHFKFWCMSVFLRVGRWVGEGEEETPTPTLTHPLIATLDICMRVFLNSKNASIYYEWLLAFKKVPLLNSRRGTKRIYDTRSPDSCF